MESNKARGFCITWDDSVYGNVFIEDLIHKRYIPAEGYSFAPASRMQLLNNLVRLFPNLIIPRDPESFETIEMTNELIHELSGFQYGQTRTGLRNFEPGTAHDDMVMSLALAMIGVPEHMTEELTGDVNMIKKKYTSEDILDDFFNETIISLDSFDNDLGSLEELI